MYRRYLFRRHRSRGAEMAETPFQRYSRWGLDAVLQRYPGLQIMPSTDEDLVLVGSLAFSVRGPDSRTLEDNYDVEIRILQAFPESIPTVKELGGRIPKDFHQFTDGTLCLGAETELRIQLVSVPTLLNFLERVVIPYFYGYSYFQKFGLMPFGELAHGNEGVLDYFTSLFRVTSHKAAREFVRLASLHRRVANKHPCPCRSDSRLGRCHHRRVNMLRALLGRTWFAKQHLMLSLGEESSPRPKHH